MGNVYDGNGDNEDDVFSFGTGSEYKRIFFPANHHFSFKLMKINRTKSVRYTQTPIVFVTLFVTGSVPEVINISTLLIGLNSQAYFS